jgi:DNA-binding response OmpR family regulator
MSSMKLLLERNGFKVLLARTREHMRHVLADNPVDVALLDESLARDLPEMLTDLKGSGDGPQVVLLGMRAPEWTDPRVDAYCARLDGPEKLLGLLNNTTVTRVKAQPA